MARKLTDQARRVNEALSNCFSELAGPGGELRAAPRLTFPTISPLGDTEYSRLRSWLNKLAERKDALAYAALLQIWLNAHNIEWPQSVFAPGKDLTSGGRGSRGKGKLKDTGKSFELDHKKVLALKRSGKSYTEIAKELGIAQNRHKKTLRQAGDRIRKAMASTGYSVGSLDEEVVKQGLLMLDIHPPTQQELQELDDLMREIIGPEYDTAVDS
jgi:hypothetical protein